MSKPTLKLLVVSSLILLFSLILALGAFWYRHQSGAELIEQLSSVQNKEVMDVARNSLATAEEKALADSHRLNELVLSDEADAVELLSVIDSWTKENGVTADTTDLKIETVKKGSYDDLVIKLSFAGSESAVRKMISMVELLPYHSQVEQLNFKRLPNNLASASLSLRIAIKKSS